METILHLTGPLDPRSGWRASPDRCPIARALDVMSTRSAFLIMREAFYGTSRFDDFVGRAEISEPVAAARLRELVSEGLLVREPYREPGQRTRHRYRLTEKGADLLPVLVGLIQWSQRWLDDDGAGGVLALRHRDCGERVGVGLRCAADHEVAVGELDLTLAAAGAR
ncbi:MAG: helix-turn-helix transcriptional regulator [Solirubrobacterales bacterium]|jgi:DNA-binding HxlR family transcriptional regulator|nr:helix-turn-helix transcriptional regulator [Solirubrobacterales bacterium]